MLNEALRDDQWERIKGFLPGTKGHVGRRGFNTRLFVDALLWFVRSGARWKDLPERFGKVQTVKTRYYKWVASGVFDRLFSALTEDADGEWHIPDSTIVRAHQHAAGARHKRGARMPRAWAVRAGAFPQRSMLASTGSAIPPPLS